MEMRKVFVAVICSAALCAAFVLGGLRLLDRPPFRAQFEPRIPTLAVIPQIIIEDDHRVTWMPMSNWFANDNSKWKVMEEHWKGILFQLGLNRALNETTGEPDSTWTPDPNEILVTIVGTGSASPLNLTVQKFNRWINVMAVDNLGRPQHPNPSRPHNEPMDQSLACVLAPDLQGCAPPNAVCSNLESTVTPAGMECLRRKRLHLGFVPYRVLTYWPGPHGYEMKAQRYTPFHMEYVFSLLDPIKVTVDGSVPSNLGAIDRIIIKTNPSYTPPPNRHMDTEDPPWPIP